MAHTKVLETRNLSKSFPGVQALAGVDLKVETGEVHALVGENGAGKSTLMRILAGLDRPDSGTIYYKGEAVSLRHPCEAFRLGISMIHQDLMPFPEMTVAENILMGQEPETRFPGWIDRRALNQQATIYLRQLGAVFPAGRLLKELGLAQMQTVEIARALARRAEVIIMDEPTSALSDPEVRVLFDVIGELKQQGVAVIYASHKMEEVLAIGDRVTVLRDGRTVGTHRAVDLQPDQLIALMVGRQVKPSIAESNARRNLILLAVRGLGRTGGFQDIQFDIRAGEILGIAGLMGAGRTELVEALFGLHPADRGTILVREEPVRIRSPREAIRHGIGLVSENRTRYGLVLSMSVRQNITLASLGACCRGPMIDPSKEAETAEAQIRRFGIKASSVEQNVRFLSGGNQQKVVLAKTLLNEPDILLMDEPTRGIDVGAKEEIYKLIRSLARQGKAILLVSSELPEILSLSDRLLVMREGELSAELDPRVTTQEEVMQHAMLN